MYQLAWLGIYMGIGLAIIFLLPFPVDLILLFSIIVVINFFRRRRFMKKYLGRGGIRDLFGSLSSSVSGNHSR
jgi:membrane protein implicated in regulation of membrane protease activity